jgi:HAD superfamily hydrolase (TIGR01509 family)
MKFPEQSIRAVAFDFDGLMFNTEDVFSLSAEVLLSARGLTMPSNLIQDMMGKRPHDSFQVLVDATGIDEPIDDLLAESRDIFLSLLDEHLAPMPGVFELLDELERRDIPKAIATSSPRHHLDEMFGRYDLESRFEFALTSENVTNGKPEPEIYLTAAKRFGVRPAEMIVFEDSEAGTNAGANANAYVISVPHDHSRTADFSRTSLVAESLLDSRIIDALDFAPAT